MSASSFSEKVFCVGSIEMMASLLGRSRTLEIAAERLRLLFKNASDADLMEMATSGRFRAMRRLGVEKALELLESARQRAQDREAWRQMRQNCEPYC